MSVWLVYGTSREVPWEETLLQVCETEDAAHEWIKLYLNTDFWMSCEAQCWSVCGKPS